MVTVEESTGSSFPSTSSYRYPSHREKVNFLYIPSHLKPFVFQDMVRLKNGRPVAVSPHASPGYVQSPKSSASAMSLDFTTIIKDPKTGRPHQLHLAAHCGEGIPARIYINGKAFGPCEDE